MTTPTGRFGPVVRPLASFGGPRPALLFATAARTAAGPGVPVECRRAPDGRWWVFGASPDQDQARADRADRAARDAFIRGLGGAVRSAGDPAAAGAATWPVQDFAKLAVLCATVGPLPAGLRVVYLLTPATAADQVVRRCLELSALCSVEGVAVGEWVGEYGAVLVRAAADPAGPPLRVRALNALEQAAPGTLALRPADPAERLLLQLRLRLPVAESVVAAALPQDDRTWLLGPAVGGRWGAVEAPAVGGQAVQLTPVTRTGWRTESAQLLRPPEIPAPVPPRPNGTGSFVTGTQSGAAVDADRPQLGPVPVRLAPSSAADAGRIDAVLLDDGQLALLHELLSRRMQAEDGLLLLGPGRHLLVEPGGLLGAVPFDLGRRMWRPGPEPLFLETGCDLAPPVPPSLRRRLFGLSGGRVVALWEGGAAAFRAETGVPIWSTWLVAPPEPDLALSPAAISVLTQLAQYGPVRVEPPAGAPPPTDGAFGGLGRLGLGRPGPERPEPAQAAVLELQGDFAAAARLLQAAGRYAAAARLWEQAEQAAQSDPADYSAQPPYPAHPRATA